MDDDEIERRLSDLQRQVEGLDRRRLLDKEDATQIMAGMVILIAQLIRLLEHHRALPAGAAKDLFRRQYEALSDRDKIRPVWTPLDALLRTLERPDRPPPNVVRLDDWRDE